MKNQLSEVIRVFQHVFQVVADRKIITSQKIFQKAQGKVYSVI